MASKKTGNYAADYAPSDGKLNNIQYDDNITARS